jgi:hypothetical protein
MRINVAIPDANVDAPVLDAALESVTRLDETMLQEGAPTFERALRSGIEWRPEPPGDESFDHIKTVLGRGWGDCDDLAPYHAASLRHSGEDPHATAVVRKSGRNRWHAVVQRGDGSIDDPSARAGMNGVHEYRGAFQPLMAALPRGVSGAYRIRPNVAIRPTRGGWQARTDIPWNYFEKHDSAPTPTDYAMTTLHTTPVASTALVGSIMGACILGEAAGFADPDHLDRLYAMCQAIQGADFEEIAEEFGPEHAQAATQIVGSLFGGLAKLARGAVKFIPGVGPIADEALNMASKLMPHGGGGGGGGGGAIPAPNFGFNGGGGGGMGPGTRHGRICFPATFE